MVEFLNAIIEYQFLQKAIYICFLTSVCCAVLGTYIVYRKMVFITSSISHASFGGIGIGIYLIYLLNLSIDPVLFAIIFSVACGVCILYIQKNINLESDTVIGIIMAFGMAIGILFMYITPGYQKDVSTYLFGNILLASSLHIKLLAILDIVILFAFIAFNKAIKYLSFDEKFYRLLGVPTNFIDYFMIILISISVIIIIKNIGIVLIISIFTIPQTISSMITNSYNKVAILSTIISFISMFFGIYFSYRFKIPSTPSIILTLSVLFLMVMYIKKGKSKK